MDGENLKLLQTPIKDLLRKGQLPMALVALQMANEETEKSNQEYEREHSKRK